jgi:hypothetical protein
VIAYSVRFTPRSISSTCGCVMLSAIVFCTLPGAAGGGRVGAASDGLRLRFKARVDFAQLSFLDLPIQRCRRGRHSIQARSYLIEQVISGHVWVLFEQLVTEGHRIFAESNFIG